MARPRQDSDRVVRTWPIPLWRLSWLRHDPVRGDLVAGFYVFGLGALVASPGFLLILFLACFAGQAFRGLARLNGKLEERGWAGAGCLMLPAALVVVAVSVAFPPAGVAIGAALLLLRLSTLSNRPDRALLLHAACIWLALAFVSACWHALDSQNADRPVSAIARDLVMLATLGGFVGVVSSAWLLSRGFRLRRLPLALFESTTLVFGVVLAGASVARSVAAAGGDTRNVAETAASRSPGQPVGVGVPGRPRAVDLASGEVIWVRGYQRSIADGVEANNLSTPSQNSPPGPTESVRGHFRSRPDGLKTNNLSWQDSRGPSAHPNSEPTQGIRPRSHQLSALNPSLVVDVGALAATSGAARAMEPNAALVTDVRLRAAGRSGWFWNRFIRTSTPT